MRGRLWLQYGAALDKSTGEIVVTLIYFFIFCLLNGAQIKNAKGVFTQW